MRKKLESQAKNFVVKSNALVEARYRLSLQESQIVLWLLTQIQPDDEDFKPHRLDVIKFANLVQVDVQSKYRELRKVTKRLMQRVMEIYSPIEDKTIQVAWLSSAEYEHKKGFVSLEFSPKLKPYLLQLKSHFTKIDIVDTLKLKSIYAVRIFELLLQYNHIGNREISIADLRAYCGIQETEYDDYFDLKRYVIERAKSEISAKTDYEIDFTEIKQSRKVVAIEWTIQKKDIQKEERLKKLALFQRELRSEALLTESLMEYGFSRAIAKLLLKNHGEDVVRNAVRAVNNQVEGGNVKNPKAMLQSAIQQKWHPEVFKQKKV